MYKVFFNDHSLTFCEKSKSLLKNNNAQIVEIEDFSEFEKRFPNCIFMELPENLIVVCNQPKLIWNEFCKKRVQIPAAGGLVRNENKEILFIKRLGRWDLPKGKIENGETIRQAAIREVEEECGLSQLEIVRKLNSTFHLYHSPYIKTGDDIVLKETSWFEMRYLGQEIPVPQIEEDILEVRWIKEADLKCVYQSTYNNLLELLKSYLL